MGDIVFINVSFFCSEQIRARPAKRVRGRRGGRRSGGRVAIAIEEDNDEVSYWLMSNGEEGRSLAIARFY